jgi:hypothetical protein
MSSPRNIEFEFATILSRDELVVHLGRLVDPMTLGQLADLFTLPCTFILLSLELEPNREIQLRMYEDVRSIYSPGTSDDYDIFLDLDEQGSDGARTRDEPPEGAKLPPSTGLRRDELTAHLLDAYHASGGNAGEAGWRWELPPMDLVFTLTPHLTRLLKAIHATGPQRAGIDAIVRVDRHVPIVERLEDAVAKLDRAARVRQQVVGHGRSASEAVAAVTMIRSALNLQARHWAAEYDAGRITVGLLESHLESLALIDRNVAAVSDEVTRRRIEEIEAEEGPAADALLDLIHPTRGDKDLARLIELVFTTPELFERAEVERVFTACLNALTSLAKSVRYERLVDEHVVDLLVHGAEVLTRDASFELRPLDPATRAMVEEGFEEAITALRTGAEAEHPERRSRTEESCLRWMGRGVRGYRLGLSAVSSILEEGVVAKVFCLLYAGFGTGSARVTRASQGFAVLLLRGLANNAVAYRHTIEGQGFVMGAPLLRKVLSEIQAIGSDVAERVRDGKRADWDRMGKRLKDLQVRPVPRSASGARLRRNVSIAAVLFALAPALDDLTLDETLVLGASLVNLAEHSLRLGEIASGGNVSTFFSPPDALHPATKFEPVKRKLLSPVKGTTHPGSGSSDNRYARFDRGMKILAGLAAGLGAGASAVRLASGRLDATDSWLELFLGLSNLSVAVGQVMMGPLAGSFGGTLFWGAFLNMTGVAVGIAVFLAQIYVDVAFNDGMLPVVRELLRQLEKMPATHECRDLFDDLFWLFDQRHTAFSTLGGADDEQQGQRTDAVWSGRPTWWRAAKMGFSPHMIAVMFDAGKVPPVAG